MKLWKQSPELALQDLRVHERYRLRHKIGGGGFGVVYLGMLAEKKTSGS